MSGDNNGLLAKYSWLTKLLVAAAIVAGVLGIAPSAQSQAPALDCFSLGVGGTTQFCLDKTVSPDPATVGEPITFTIRETVESSVPSVVGVIIGFPLVDTLPPGLQDVSITQSVTPPGFARPCTVSENTVVCPGSRFIPTGGAFTLTIEATPTECGDFVNHATDTVNTVEAPFTVVGCEEPAEECPPVSQELGQEAQSGGVSLSGGVENSGDYAGQTAAPLQFGDSGNLQNATGVVQACGSVLDDVESGGITKEISPTLDTASDRTVGQSSGASE